MNEITRKTNSNYFYTTSFNGLGKILSIALLIISSLYANQTHYIMQNKCTSLDSSTKIVCPAVQPYFPSEETINLSNFIASLPNKKVINPSDLKRLEEAIDQFDPNTLYPPRNLPLIALYAHSFHPRVRNLTFKCIENGAPIHGLNQALLMAVFNNDDQLTKKLLETGASCNFRSKGLSPLAIAIKRQNFKIAYFLIKNGASLHEEQNGTPLWFNALLMDKSLFEMEDDIQIAQDFKDFIIQLIPKNLINKKDLNKKTILDHSIEKENIFDIIRLIENGATETIYTEKLQQLVQDSKPYTEYLKSPHFLKLLIERNFLPIADENGLFLSALIKSKQEELKVLLFAKWGIDESLLTDLERLEKPIQLLINAANANSDLSIEQRKEALRLIKTFKIGYYYQEQIQKYESQTLSHISKREIQAKEFIKQKKEALINEEENSQNTFISAEKKPFMEDVLYFLHEEGADELIPAFIDSYMRYYPLDEIKPSFLIAMDKTAQLNHAWYFNKRGILMGGKVNQNAKQISETISQVQVDLNQTNSSLNNEPIIQDILSKLKQSLETFILGSERIDLDKLNKGIPLIFLTGYSNHVIIFSIERGYRLSLYNTGAGVSLHARWEDTNKFMTHITYDQVPPEEALNNQYLKEMLSYKDGISWEPPYQLLEKWAKSGVKMASSLYEQDYQRKQASGSCSAQAFSAFMRDFIMRQTQGSEWERLGLYKYIKALIRTQLLSTHLENTPNPLRFYIDKKIQKYKREISLFKIYAQDINQYNAAVSSIGPLLDPKLVESLEKAVTPYERFSLLLVALNKISDSDARNIPQELAVISDIIKERRIENKEASLFTFKNLDTLMNLNPTLAQKSWVELNRYSPHLRETLKTWKEKQNQSVVSLWDLN